MSKSKRQTGQWVKHPVNFYRDPNIQLMIRKLGHDAVNAYQCLLDEMWYYGDFNYEIPEACLGSIAGVLQMTELRLREIIVYLVGIEYLQVDETEDNGKCIYSAWRREELVQKDITSARNSANGTVGMRARWSNKDDNE